MAPNDLLSRLGIAHPILLAPMAGGPSTAELAAAVSQAGGLGSIGAAYLAPEQISEVAQAIRARTDRPFAINLFAGGHDAGARGDATRMLSVLAPIHARLGLPPPAPPTVGADPFPAQLDAVLDVRPAAFTFTFGVPSARDLARVRGRGILVVGTATTVDEGQILADAGVDAVVAQGAEAGGHRGTFRGPFEAALVPTDALVEGLARAISLPIIASGGIMDGRDLARALARGAGAAQLGTAFLACPECGASRPYKDALLAAGRDTTVVTRVFSGRPARGLRNAFIDALAGSEEAVLPYPLQNALTRPMRTAAAKHGEAGYLSLWAGQGVARIRSMAAGELVARLVDELRAAGAAP